CCDNGHAVPIKAGEGIDNPASAARIKPGRRLIEEKIRRIQCDDPSQRRQPLLAMAQRAWRAYQKVFVKTHFSYGVMGFYACFTIAIAPVPKSESYIVIQRFFEKRPLRRLHRQPYTVPGL